MEDELDLRILKTIVHDKVSALTFSYNYNFSLFSQQNQQFGKVCLDYIKTYKTNPTERTLLESQKDEYKKQLIESKLQELTLVEHNVSEFPFDLEKLKKRYQVSKVEEIRKKAAEEDSAPDPEKFYKDLSLRLNEIASIDMGRSFVHKSAGDYIEEFKEKYEAIKNNPEVTQCIKTGFSAYDSVTGGIAPAELIMWGGESNSGKSMILNNVGANIWLQENEIDKEIIHPGKNILYFSLEMPHEDCFNRFLACVADVPQIELREGRLDYEQEVKVEKALEFIRKYQEQGFYFDIVDVPRGLTIGEMELRYSDALLRYVPDVVVVDYMGLMELESLKSEQDWLKMGGLAAALHEFARYYNIPVVTAHQLTDLKRSSQSQSAEDHKRVGMHRWGRSSLIMHHVNVGIQIETRQDEREQMDLAYHLVKNRKGPLASGNLIKQFEHAKLIDVPVEEKEKPPVDIQELLKKFKEKSLAKEQDEEN